MDKELFEQAHEIDAQTKVKFDCCFCGQPIDHPVAIHVEFDWDNKQGDDPAVQTWYTHGLCLVSKLQSNALALSDVAKKAIGRELLEGK